VISGDLTVARLLDEHPELVEVLASYHPHFKHLRNRVLRRIMAPRVTVAQAARMAGVPADDLLTVLREAVGEAPRSAPDPALSSEERRFSETPSLLQAAGRGEDERPRALAGVPEACRVHLDVREDIRRGEEPFARIMAAVKALAQDHVLVLRAPFEPIPLYDALGQRGLGHWTECHAPDDWSVWFYREDGALAARPMPAPERASTRSRRTVLDVRGLEPPQPMVRVLQEIDRLGPGAELEVHHDRRPMFLYPQLEERGFVHDTDEPKPGLVRILIRRGGA
jgi:uncharacterized protein (DUF2249 family)